MTLHMLEHSTNGALINPDQLCTMIARPQRVALLPRSLVIEADREVAFAVRGLMIGNRDVTKRDAGGLTLFVLDGMDMRGPELAQWFSLSLGEVIRCAMDFRLDVQNLSSRKASPFVARWTCEEIIDHQSAPPTDRVGNLGELMSGASGLHRVPGRSGRPGLETRPQPGWGWDPGDPDGEG